MRFDRKTVTLKNGETCLLRSPEGKDAAEILKHLRQTSAETGFMARYENEIQMTAQEEQDCLEHVISDPKSIMICAEIGGKIAANAGLNRVAPFRKYQHRAEFGISVKQKYWHMGIGESILTEIIKSAEKADYEQIELEVVADNERAIGLYRKFGFEIYGTRQRSFRFDDGSYAAEHLMLLKL